MVAYLLNMICLILQLLYKLSIIYTFWYNFDTVLYQFLETETSDRYLICIVQRLRFSGFILYSLSFFLYSPFKLENRIPLSNQNLLVFSWGYKILQSATIVSCFIYVNLQVFDRKMTQKK